MATDQTFQLLRRHEHRILAGMLFLLYCALVNSEDEALQAACVTAHLGTFLLWQPIWQRDRRLEFSSLATLVALTIAFILVANLIVLAIWQIVLIGIIAGRSLAQRREKIVYLASLACLLVMLFVITGPDLFGVYLSVSIKNIFKALTIAVLALLVILPSDTGPTSRSFPIDFFRGVTIALMTALVAMSAAMFSLNKNVDYTWSLLLALLGLGGFLFALSWLLSPRTGIGGLADLWEKSLLNIGTPFEEWLTELSEFSATTTEPDTFLQSALDRLNDMPWVSGVMASVANKKFEIGDKASFSVSHNDSDIHLDLYSSRPVGPALYLHHQLLLRLVADFYLAKQREFELAHESHLKAVYETGSRITHDVKNLLQALNTLTATLDEQTSGNPEDLARHHVLIKKQLPRISQRLEVALEKLAAPVTDQIDLVAARQWWEGAQAQFADPWIAKSAKGDLDQRIPQQVFETVADNLIDNIRFKRSSGKQLNAELVLEGSDQGVSLTVSDTGDAIPARVADKLLQYPVESASGFGVGLYQVANLAKQHGYALSLTNNRDGEVTFCLAHAK